MHVAEIPPSPLIREFTNMPLPDTRLRVLDVGCLQGRNALHFARLGHEVIGLSLDHEDLKIANEYAKGSLSYVAGDVKNLPFRGNFDVLLLNEVLQDIDRSDWPQVLKALQQHTSLGGFNVVSAYIGSKPNTVCNFELYDRYKKLGWQIVKYSEDQLSEDTAGVTSLARLIAARTR